jgi:hypothetical protein
MSAPLQVPPAYTGTVHRQFPAKPRKAKVEPLSIEARRAWVVVRDEGGFYTPRELGEMLLPSLAPKFAAMSAGRWLSALHRRQHVALHPAARPTPAYGVTSRCIPIPGMSLEPSTEGSPE